MGTRGDLVPFFALAQGLKARGYPVTLLSNSNWRGEAISLGCDFRSIADPDEPQCGRNDHDFFVRCTLPAFERSYGIIEQMVRRGSRPVLLYRSNMVGMECAARSFSLLSGRIVLQPSAIRSTARPPWPLTKLTLGNFGRIGRRIVVPMLYGLSDWVSPYRRHSNHFRRSVGLKEKPESLERESFSLLLCPRWFALPQEDWPKDLYLPGFLFGSPGRLDPSVAEFIREQGRPLVFTPGTGVSNTEDFFKRAAEAVSNTAFPAIFLSRHIPEKFRSSSRILCRDFAPLGSLLPSARAIFHHGGIGTTAEALRAGIPQIVVPGRFDQPDNAMRVATLAFGASIMSDRYSGRHWAELLDRTLRSMHVATQLSAARRLISEEDAVANAIEIIEHHARARALAA